MGQVVIFRRAARRRQGGRLTTLNFRTGAVTTLNFFHVLIFLWSNISRKQTRQYRKSTTTTTSRAYHGYQQVLSQLRSALPILPSTQRPDFQLIFKRLMSKSACLRGSAPDPAGALQRPQTPSWKRLVLTTLLKKNSRATGHLVHICEKCFSVLRLSTHFKHKSKGNMVIKQLLLETS